MEESESRMRSADGIEERLSQRSLRLIIGGGGRGWRGRGCVV